MRQMSMGVYGPGSGHVHVIREDEHNRYKVITSSDFDKAIAILDNDAFDKLVDGLVKMKKRKG